MAEFLVTLNNFLSMITTMLSFGMLLMALGIFTVKTVRQMIPLYKAQSFLLALVTLLIGINPTIENPGGISNFRHLSVLPFVAIPLILAISIEPLLALATVSEDIPSQERWSGMRDRLVRIQIQTRALPIWLEHRPTRRSEWLSLPLSLIIILVAFGISFAVAGKNVIQAMSLGISLALIMIGLTTMIDKQDIIAMIMGLLVMEHGLFLASVQVIASPQVTILFVISLFFYIIITLTILVFLLPELHSISRSIQVDDQKELRG